MYKPTRGNLLRNGHSPEAISNILKGDI